MGPLVSVIVPVYRAEDFLARCVDSIVGQTYPHIELILVNDGSPDNCGVLCDEYARGDSRVRVIHQQNAGVSVARNNALDQCSGEYITFVDADDYIDTSLIAALVDSAESQQADILLFDHYEIADGEQQLFVNNWRAGITTEEIKRGIVNDDIFNAPWGKFFRRAVWDGLRFPVNAVYEDLFIMPSVFAKAKLAAYVPLQQGGYYYNRENPHSITSPVTDGPLKRYHKFRACEEHRRNAELMGWPDIARKSEVKALREAIRMMYLNIGAVQLTSQQISEGVEYLRTYPDGAKSLPRKYRILRWSLFYCPPFFRLYGVVKGVSLRWKTRRYNAALASAQTAS